MVFNWKNLPVGAAVCLQQDWCCFTIAGKKEAEQPGWHRSHHPLLHHFMVSEEDYSARVLTDCCVPKPNHRTGQLQRWVDARPSTLDGCKPLIKRQKLLSCTVLLGLKMETPKRLHHGWSFPCPDHIQKTIKDTQGEPVKLWFAGELEAVDSVQSGTEDQVALQPFFWKHSANSITGLHVDKLQFINYNTAQVTSSLRKHTLY